MSKINKLKKQVEYIENASEKYNRFFQYKLFCSICNTATNLQWFNHHLTTKKCKKMQNLIFKKDELNDKVQLLKDKVFFIKYGNGTLKLNENSNISKDELNIMLEIKEDLENARDV